MQSVQSIEGPGVPGTADENGEVRQQKPKTLPCKYCSKRFRDLLVRHEKLVHLNEGSHKDGNRPRKPSSAGAVQPPLPAQNHVDSDMMGMPRAQPQPFHADAMSSVGNQALAPDPRLPARTGACNLDLLSDAATRIASANEVSSMQPMMADLGHPATGIPRIKHYDEGMSYGDRGREPDTAPMSVDYPPQQGQPAFDDYNLFLDEFNTSSHFLPQAFEVDPNLSIWPRLHSDLQRGGLSKPPSQFPSRFPSLAPEPRDPSEIGGRTHDESRAWALRVSAAEHMVIKNRLDEFSSVLPNDFVFPSRHTLTRFLDGYVSGFHEHFPILHLPTLTPTDLSPELLLAILAVGAQYRFESHRSNALCSPNTPQSRMETIQSLLLLFAVALRIWQMSFEQHQARVTETSQQSASDSFLGGPIAYNSTALWRLASIRLYTDLNPSRTLETRDAGQIAQAFSDAPYLIRSMRLNRAVLQAIHALSMLVKLGVNYVARRKSSEWSMQHSLCNLECVILLSKWLMTLATINPATDPPPSPDERSLLEMLRRMLDETEFAVPIDPSLAGGGPGHPNSNTEIAAGDGTKLRQLAAAVIRLWAETFKGSHVFDIVKIISNGLEGYADLLEKPRDRTPLRRLASH
ncbi:hypothetical protein SLS62_004493 [Diatrype stigma]|uniref:Xylanolytic transcriptional activator regulatory domain-containing protein n=1 Tax=Diatrype stigma TaxID=117547 RepID=A0AAN9YTQ2_9PEZI